MAKIWKVRNDIEADPARCVLGIRVGERVVSTQSSSEDPMFVWCYPQGEYGPDTSRVGWVWIGDLEYERDLAGAWCRVNKGKCLQQTLTAAFGKYRGRACFGTRRQPDGSLGEYRWLLYEQVERWVKDFASGLRLLTPPRSFICISSSNRMEWAVADLACSFQSLISVPIHHKADRATIEYILNQTEASTLVCSKALLPAFAQCLPQCAKVQHVILMDEDTDALPVLPQSVKIHTMKDITANGANKPAAPLTTEPEELSTIMYTSGSTGTPKGAMMNERNWHNHLAHPYTLPDNLITFSYGPFAHIQERQNIGITLITGGKLSFYDGDMTQLFENVRMCAPTWISAVPRVWSELYLRYKDDLEKHITAEMKADPTKAAESFFKHRCELKVQKDYHPLLGGKVEYIVIGGAVSGSELKEWLKTTFKCPIYDGYGTTEAGSIATDNVIGPGVSIRLLDVPDLGYTSADKPHPRGEILVKSNQIIQGYFKDAQTTAEMFTPDGYFRTGDIGEQLPDGKLRIIDRRKNIFKLENGEFVAPEQLEQLYLQSEFVSQIFITGDSTRSCLATVVVPSFNVLTQWAEKNHFSLPASRADICSDSRVHKAIVASITEIGTKSRRAPYEIPRALILHPDSLTEESGLVTPSNKLKRPACAKFFAAKVAHFYEEMSWSYEKFMGMLDQMRSGNKECIDGKRTLVQLGTDSLAAMRLKEQILQTFHKDIPTEVLLTATLQELADMLLNDRGPEDPGAILARAIQTDTKLVVPLVQSLATAKATLVPAHLPFVTVLITGTTGFLGLHILLSLLKRAPSVCIVCIVRGSGDEDARSRLLTTASKHGVKWEQGWLSRVEVHAGDVSRERMGLEPALYAQLTVSVDAIYHAAALVNWVLPYSQMREPNVLGTISVLRFALTAKLKHIFHVSTISTCGATEDQMWQEPVRLGSYAASKWVSELHVSQCLSAGVPGAIFRPGMITAHSVSGASNPEDYVNRYLQTVVKLGAYINDERRLDMTPVDYVADTIVSISLESPRKHFGPFNVTNPQAPTYTAIGAAMSACGYSLAALQYDSWRARLVAAKDTPLEPLLSFFPPDQLALHTPQWDTRRTTAAMNGVRSCPILDSALMRVYLQSLASRGLIPEA